MPIQTRQDSPLGVEQHTIDSARGTMANVSAHAMYKQKTLDGTCKHEAVPNIMFPTFPPKYQCKHCGAAFRNE